jgi:hypothetical protein
MVPSYVAVALPAGPIPPLAAALFWLVAMPVLAVRARTVPEPAAGG